MQAQGWQPGDFLGAKDANHAEHYTAANASHIRVAVKDDNLGLGAKIGSGVGHGECTGLDAFKNLLGRLNGQDEDELEKEQKSREDLKRAIYTERKWGSIRFVPGGLLIGDKIQDLIEGEAERLRKLADGGSSKGSDNSSSSSEEEEVSLAVNAKKSKKRKAEAENENQEIFAVKIKKSKKDRKPERASNEAQRAAEEIVDSSGKKREEKHKKERNNRKQSLRAMGDSTDKSIKKSKKDKRRHKLDGISESITPSTKESTPATPVESGRSTPMLQGRHAVRSRNIAQKRLASMDIASLNQVCALSTKLCLTY
jgi:Pin2-interacting protein X1